MKLLLPIILLSFIGCAGNIDQVVNTDPNPSCQYEVYRHDPSGWLLKTPEMHFIYDGSYWTTGTNFIEPQYYQNAWHNMLDLGTVLQRLSEYGIESGTLDPVDHYSEPKLDVNSGFNLISKQITVDDSILVADINNNILAGTIPFPNDNTIYVIMLPPNVITTTMVSNSWNGYHSHTAYGSNRYTFAIIQYNSNYDSVDEVISHELAESSTDPDNYTGYYAVSQEIGDLCEAYTEEIDGYRVQKVFSESACQCL